MDIKSDYSKHGMLAHFVAMSIRDSAASLSTLQDMTGLHRSKLGRMRLGRHPVTLAEAELVFRALGKPARALFMLVCLGEECIITPEALGYFDHFLSGLPTLIERLNEFGSNLNPKWGSGSVHHLAGVLAELAERRIQADQFRTSRV